MQTQKSTTTEEQNPYLKAEDPGTLWLRLHNCRADGTPRGEKTGRSVRAVSTPVGGARRQYGQRFGR